VPSPTTRFRGGPEVYVHPGVLCAVLLAGILIFLLPRKYVVVPLLAAALLIPMDQAVLIGPLHWTMLRIIVLIGWMRVLSESFFAQRLFPATRLNAIDKAVMLWAGTSALNIVLLWRSWPALINQLGAVYNFFGIYFLLRLLIPDGEHAVRAIHTLTGIAVVVAAIMVMELAIQQRIYAALSSPERSQALWGRLGTLRAVAGFGNPVCAGVFGATLMPLSLGLWWKKHRSMAVVGVVAASVIVIASFSSTPVLAYVAGVLGLCLWPARRHLRLLRWTLLIFLLALHFLMKAPVWALIQRVSIIGGSSGYHRFMLVDNFFQHFGDWWLLGARDAGDWGYFAYDIANQYVGIGESAGLVPFLLFIAAIVYGFKYLGRARQGGAGSERRFMWTVGCALLAHVVAFFGLSYFDQLVVVWYALLAIISAVAVAPVNAEAKASAKRFALLASNPAQAEL